jgi:hypothetical protein
MIPGQETGSGSRRPEFGGYGTSSDFGMKFTTPSIVQKRDMARLSKASGYLANDASVATTLSSTSPRPPAPKELSWSREALQHPDIAQLIRHRCHETLAVGSQAKTVHVLYIAEWTEIVEYLFLP